MAIKYKYSVAIECMTYNHSKYITDALDGFVMQDTDFPYVIMLVDDASTDGEEIIISDYLDTNFNLSDNAIAYTKETEYANIIFAQHKTNLNCFIVVMYLKYNHYQIGKKYEKLKYLSEWLNNSKYVAICEGDDYWIDPLKLKKQVDFLNANQNFVLSHTGFEYLEENVTYTTKGNIRTEQNLSIISSKEDLKGAMLDRNRYLVQTMTVVIRMEAFNKAQTALSEYGNLFLMGDTQLWVTLLSYGSFHFLPDVTSFYRLHLGSACHSVDLNKQMRFMLSCAEMRVFFGEKYNISSELQMRFQREYKRILLKYMLLDLTYKPFVKCKFNNAVEKFLYSIAISRLCRMLLRPIIQFYYRNLY